MTPFTSPRSRPATRSRSDSTVGRLPHSSSSNCAGTALYFITTSQPVAVHFDLVFDGVATTELIPYNPGLIVVRAIGWSRTGLDAAVEHSFRMSPSAQNVVANGVSPWLDLDYFVCVRGCFASC